MSQEKDCYYTTAPHLICVEKSPLSLTLHHFGNVLVFNSLNPQLALHLLTQLKEPRTRDELARSNPPEILSELDRLIGAGFVHSFKPGKEEVRGEAPGPRVLDYLTLNQRVRDGLIQRLLETRTGIVDFCGLGPELREQLSVAGYEKIGLLSGDCTPEFVQDHDFFFVLGLQKHRLWFSKINQLLLPQKKCWLLVTADLFGGMVGPAFGAEGGPCYDCIIDQSQRHFDRQYHQADYVDLIATQGRATEDLSGNPMAKGILSFAVTESLKVVSGLSKPMAFDGFFSFDLFNFRMNYQPINPSASCPVCGGV